MKRKLRGVAALLVMILLIGACGTPSGTDENQTTPTPVADVTESPEAAPTEEPAATPTKVPDPTATPGPTEDPGPTPTPEPWVGGSEAAKIIANMTIGWNLGNTLDSQGSVETAWGNPMTTQEMIDAVAAAGFNTIRLPVTWYCRTDGDFTVKESWLARVKEVVDYCYNNDMYVILNTHHETGWNVPTLAKVDGVEKKFVYLWQQIAEYFKDYDEHLIFEGMNEPREVGSAAEWSGGTTEGRQIVTRLNNAFVETVRATGGNNATRVLLITSYGANSSRIAMYGVKVPNDPYIGVSIHAYTPYNFTFNTKNEYDVKVWDGSKAGEIDALFRDINDIFLSKGVPVVLTEFGAENKSKMAGGEDNLAARCAWVTYYLTKAKEYGVPCVQWDNNLHTGSGELFGLLNRKTCEWYEPEYIEAMMEAVYE